MRIRTALMLTATAAMLFLVSVVATSDPGSGKVTTAQGTGVSSVGLVLADHSVVTAVSSKTVQSQLNDLGYAMTDVHEHDSSDAHRVIHWQTWTKSGEPTVYITDSYPGTPGVYRVDDVSFGQTLSYPEFWCANTATDDDFDVTFSINSAKAERGVVINGTDVPRPEQFITGTFKVVGYSDCWMK